MNPPTLDGQRPRDEHGRPIYRSSETPPANEPFALWHGRVTHPDAVATLQPDKHRTACMGGWIESGDWWLHCGVCRPDHANGSGHA